MATSGTSTWPARRWLSEERFGELVALCQFLPGPASSQLGIAVGIHRAGLPGGFAAWLGFTLPSAVALAMFAYGVQEFSGQAADWLHGLKIVAAAVVALALWGMGRNLAPDRPRITIAVIAAAALLMTGGIVAQLAVIGGGAALGVAFLRPPDARPDAAGRTTDGRGHRGVGAGGVPAASACPCPWPAASRTTP